MVHPIDLRLLNLKITETEILFCAMDRYMITASHKFN